jgi:hypothetical protein
LVWVGGCCGCDGVFVGEYFLLIVLLRSGWMERPTADENHIAAHQLRRINVALEQRDGDFDALHRRRELVSVLFHSETPGQTSHHSTSTVHPKVDFDFVVASAMLRLCLASRLVFLAAILSGRSWLHAAAGRDTAAAVACDAWCCRCCLRANDDEVCKVRSHWSHAT